MLLMSHEETLEVALPTVSSSRPSARSVDSLSRSDRQIAGGTPNSAADRPGGSDRRAVHRPLASNPLRPEFQTVQLRRFRRLHFHRYPRVASRIRPASDPPEKNPFQSGAPQPR